MILLGILQFGSWNIHAQDTAILPGFDGNPNILHDLIRENEIPRQCLSSLLVRLKLSLQPLSIIMCVYFFKSFPLLGWAWMNWFPWTRTTKSQLSQPREILCRLSRTFQSCSAPPAFDVTPSAVFCSTDVLIFFLCCSIPHLNGRSKCVIYTINFLMVLSSFYLE